MAEALLSSYADFVVERSSFVVDVVSPSKVEVTPLGPAMLSAHLPPLFYVELQATDGEGIAYNKAAEELCDVVLAVFDKAAAAIQDIPQIEKFIMEDLFWSDTPMLQTISAHEGTSVECRERFHAALLKTVPPMKSYLRLYDKYLDVVRMDVAAHMAEYTSVEKSINDMQLDVKKHQKAVETIEKDVPVNILLGLYSVNTAQVRKFLVERHQALATAILKLIADKIKARGADLTDSFNKIQRSLSRGLATIEDVAELEEYMAQLPAEMEEKQRGLSDMMADQVT